MLGDDGNSYPCKVKGNFRMKGLRSTSPVIVGDRVEFKVAPGQDKGLITVIEERRNYIIRKATKLSSVTHIIAANIDQAVLIVTLAMPRTSTGFIDRFLVTAEAYHIPAAIVFNKIDLYNEDLEEFQEILFAAYQKAGYRCLAVSATRGDNIELFRELLGDKTSLLAGHSGVGKSALVNAIDTSLNIKTAEISGYHSKGMHTTTFARMYPLPGGGFIIDTPGIKEFGLIDFEKSEICERFPEMRALMFECRYSNCTHTHEPDCAVKEAIEKGEIPLFRYENYLGMMEDDDYK